MRKADTKESELEKMKADVLKPFPKADELEKLEIRLNEVLDELTRSDLTDDSAQKDAYEWVSELFPQVMSGECRYQKYEAGGFMPLHIQTDGNTLTLAHTYEQNGDLMYDPRIDFVIDRENEKITPVSYEQSSLGKYEEFDLSAEPTKETSSRINDIMEFMDTWLNNIEQTGYELTKSTPAEKTNDRSMEQQNNNRKR